MSSPLERPFPATQNPYIDPSMIESETDKSFSQSTLQQTSQKRIHSDDAAIAQREQEINDIAKGIIELADIFKELQTMVIDQGTMLDRIDYNVERMAVDVKAADKELTVVCVPIIPCPWMGMMLTYIRLLGTSVRPQSARFFFSYFSLFSECLLFCLSNRSVIVLLRIHLTLLPQRLHHSMI